LITIVAVGLHWLSARPAGLFLGLCLAVPAWAWVVELRCDWRLSRRLDQVPERATYAAVPCSTTKVIKSS
jgi:hypothetical protein